MAVEKISWPISMKEYLHQIATLNILVEASVCVYSVLTKGVNNQAYHREQIYAFVIHIWHEFIFS